nr:hypothetical protein [Actinomycetota bacterium]
MIRRRSRSGQPAAAIAVIAVAILVVGSVAASQPARSESQPVRAFAHPAHDASTPVPVPTPSAAPHVSQGTVALDYGGRQRSYLLSPALGLPAGQPAALLVVLHQDDTVVREVAATLGFEALRHEGVTVAYPSGVGGTWNVGDCCGLAMRSGADDAGFVDAVIDDVGRHTPVDPRRRALLGYSGGAMLMYRILCSPHPALAAAVDVNGSLESPCPGSVAIPDLLAVHGADDGTIGLTRSHYVQHLRITPRPVQSTLAVITAAAGCVRHSSYGNGSTTRLRWSGCTGGSSVDAVVVQGAGHRWQDVAGYQRARGWLLLR